MKILKAITAALNTNDRVIVFTQDAGLVKMFLIAEPGRWTININAKFWRWDDFIDEKIIYGKEIGQAKACIGKHVDPLVGLDENGSRLVFTKNPFFPIGKNDYVIKEDFNFPPLHIVPNFSFMLGIERFKQVVIFARDLHQYYHIKDHLALVEITHSVKSSPNRQPTHLIYTASPVSSGDTVIAYGFKSISEIMALHEAKAIIMVYDKETDLPNLERLEALMKCFTEMPDQALTPDYLAFKTYTQEVKVKADLDFLNLAGSVKKGQVHAQEITIHKNAGKSRDELFHRIPEGTWRIDKLMQHLHVSRDNLLPMFKKYEGDLEFSYIPSNHNLYYFATDGIDHRKYMAAKQFMQTNMTALKGIELEGARYLNRELDNRIERHCVGNKSRATLSNMGKLTLINPSPSDVSSLEGLSE